VKNKILGLSIVATLMMLLSACSSTGSNSSNIPITTVQEKVSSESSASVPADANNSAPSQYVIGETIKFGGYEWLVLDVRDEKALLLTKEIIAIRYGNISDVAEEALKTYAKENISFNKLSDYEEYTAVNKKYDGIYEAFRDYVSVNPEIFNDDMWYTSWEKCSLREWLNNEMDFTPNEWNKIEITEVIDKTGFGANTLDKVFLLDKDDVEKYFPRNESRGATCRVSDEEILRFLQDSLLKGSLTGVNAKRALNVRNEGIFYWWVRESDAGNYYLKPMSTEEYLRKITNRLDQSLGVRPAIWISIKE